MYSEIYCTFWNRSIISWSQNLMELISISKLAIGPAGYNFCNEIMVVKTPAILIPLLRANKEQLERAKNLEKKGICALVNKNSPQILLNKMPMGLDLIN